MILLRHGQSEFNKIFSETRRDPGIEDPELTALGHEQAARAARDLAAQRLTGVIISPYTRALQTAAPVLAVHQVPVTIMPEVRERFAFACDVGRHRDVLAERFPQHSFGHLPERWWPETTGRFFTMIRMARRRRKLSGGRDCALQAGRFWRKIASWIFRRSVARETIWDYWPRTNRRRSGLKIKPEAPGLS
jgi:broad specificity phosphatase PhoE